MFSEEFLLTLLVLVFVRNLSYTPYASLMRNTDSSCLFSLVTEEFQLHTSCWFSLMRGFSCTPDASFIE